MKDPLYIVHQPKTWEEFLGNEVVVESLREIVSRRHTHAFLFTGPPGSGKTTLAKIIATQLECDSQWGFVEINGGNDRGIDTIRAINAKADQIPLGGGIKMYLIDEAHRLTKDGAEALLKIIGEPPQHLYFVLATSEPEKLSVALKQRCATYNLKPLQDREIMRLLRRVSDVEGFEITLEILKKITLLSEGLPRQALVLLEQIAVLDSEEKMLNLLDVNVSVETETKVLCQALLNATWKEVSPLLSNLSGDSELIKRQVAGYMAAVLKNNEMGIPKTDRAARILGEFLNIPPMSGVPGICFAAYMALEN